MQGDRIEKMSIMRKKIADHMVMSIRTSPHVYSAYEVDFSRFEAFRKKHKDDYEARGAKLSFTSLIAKATVDTIREFPFVNASIDGDQIIYRGSINLGIAVALDQGLLVPVIKNADEKNLLGLSRSVADLAARAEVKRLHLFHHDPDQNDDAIDAKLDEAREALVKLGSKVICEAPAEGTDLVL